MLRGGEEESGVGWLVGRNIHSDKSERTLENTFWFWARRKTWKVDLFKWKTNKTERKRHVAMEDLYFLLSRNFNPVKMLKSFGKSVIKNWLWLKELHLKIFMCTLLLSTLQWCINNSWYLFVILQWPFHIHSIYHVLRYGSYVQIFFNASKIVL